MPIDGEQSPNLGAVGGMRGSCMILGDGVGSGCVLVYSCVFIGVLSTVVFILINDSHHPTIFPVLLFRGKKKKCQPHVPAQGLDKAL